MSERSAVFEQVAASKRKSVIAADQVLAAIKAGALKAGEKLPSERELAGLLGISRTAVREAFVALSMAGVLETRIGDGTYVAAPPKDEPASAVAALRAGGIDVLDIWRAKQEIETVILVEAVSRVSEKDIEMLQEITEQMAESITLGACQGFSLANISFHLRIADIAGRPELKRAENSLLRITQQIYKPAELPDSDFLHDHLYRAYLSHAEILAVLREDRPEDAAAAMESHFDELVRYLQFVFQGTQDVR
jgi:DNA-binding FadR family transcriptional regulator